jgi:hypothetical protein
MHIHGPALPGTTGGVLVNLMVPAGAAATGRQTFTGVVAADVFWLIRSGQTYFNIHTTLNPGGEIRGHIRQSNANVAGLMQSGFYTMPCTQIPGATFYTKACYKWTNGVAATYGAVFSDAACATPNLATTSMTTGYGVLGFAIEPYMKNYDNIMSRASGSVVVGIPKGATSTLCPNNILVGGMGTTVNAGNCPELFTPSWGNLLVDNALRFISPTDTDDDRRTGFMKTALTGNYTYQAAMTSCPDYVAMYFNGSSFVVPAFTLLAAIFAMFALLF